MALSAEETAGNGCFSFVCCKKVLEKLFSTKMPKKHGFGVFRTYKTYGGNIT